MGGKPSKRGGRFEGHKESKKEKKLKKKHRSRKTLPLPALQTSDQLLNVADHVDENGGECPADVALDLATVPETEKPIKEDSGAPYVTPDNLRGGVKEGLFTLATTGTDFSADVTLGFDPSNPELCEDTVAVDSAFKDPENGLTEDHLTLATIGRDSSADVTLGFDPSNPELCKDTLAMDPAIKDLDIGLTEGSLIDFDTDMNDWLVDVRQGFDDSTPIQNKDVLTGLTEDHLTLATIGRDSSADVTLGFDPSNPELCKDTLAMDPAIKDLDIGLTEGSLIDFDTDMNDWLVDVRQGSDDSTPIQNKDVLTENSNTDAANNDVAIGSLIVIDDDLLNNMDEFPGLLAARFIRSEDELFSKQVQSSDEEWDSDEIGAEAGSLVIHQSEEMDDNKEVDQEEKEEDKETQKSDTDMSNKSIDWSNVIHLILLPRIETNHQSLLPRLVSLLKELQQKWLSSNKPLDSQEETDQNSDVNSENETTTTYITEISSLSSELPASSSSGCSTPKNGNLTTTSVTSEESGEYLGALGGRRKEEPYDAPFPRMLSKTVVHPYSSHMRSVMSRVLAPQEEMTERQKLKQFKIRMHLKDQADSDTRPTCGPGINQGEQWDSISSQMNAPHPPVQGKLQSAQSVSTLYSPCINTLAIPFMQRRPEEYHIITHARHAPQRDNTPEVTPPIMPRIPLCWYSPHTGYVLPNDVYAPLGGYVFPHATYQTIGGNVLSNVQYQSTRAHVLPNELCTPARGQDVPRALSSATSDTTIESELRSSADRDIRPHSPTGDAVMVVQEYEHDQVPATYVAQQSSTEDEDTKKPESQKNQTLTSEETETLTSEESVTTEEPPVPEQPKAVQNADFESMYLSPEAVRHVIEWLNDVDVATLKKELLAPSKQTKRALPPDPQTIVQHQTKRALQPDPQTIVPQQTKRALPPDPQTIVPQQTKRALPPDPQTIVPQQTKRALPPDPQTIVPQQTKRALPRDPQTIVLQQTKRAVPADRQTIVSQQIKRAVLPEAQPISQPQRKHAVLPEAQPIVSQQRVVPIVPVWTESYVAQQTKPALPPMTPQFPPQQPAPLLPRTHTFPAQQTAPAVPPPTQPFLPHHSARVLPQTQPFLPQQIPPAVPLRTQSVLPQQAACALPQTQASVPQQISSSAASKITQGVQQQIPPFTPHPPAWCPTMIALSEVPIPLTECNPPTAGTYYCMSAPCYYQPVYQRSPNENGLHNPGLSSNHVTKPDSTCHESKKLSLPVLSRDLSGNRTDRLRSTIKLDKENEQQDILMKDPKKCERVIQAERHNMNGYMERKPTRVHSKYSQRTKSDNTRRTRTDELTDSYTEDRSSQRSNTTHHGEKSTYLPTRQTKANPMSNKVTKNINEAPSSRHGNDITAHLRQNGSGFTKGHQETIRYLSDQQNVGKTKHGKITNETCGQLTGQYGNDTSEDTSFQESSYHSAGSNQETSSYKPRQYKRIDIDSKSDERRRHENSEDREKSIQDSTLSHSYTDADLDNKPPEAAQSRSKTDTDSETKMERIKQNMRMIIPHPPVTTKQQKPNQQNTQRRKQKSTKALSTDELRAKLRELSTYDKPRQNTPECTSVCLKQTIDFAHARGRDKSDKGGNSRMRDWSHNSFNTKK